MSKWIIGTLLVLSGLWSVETFGDAGYRTASHHASAAAVLCDTDWRPDDPVHAAPPPAVATHRPPVWRVVGEAHGLPPRLPAGPHMRQPARGPPALSSR